MEKHFHLASGLHGATVVYYEKQYESAYDSITDFVQMASSIFKNYMPVDVASAEDAMIKMADTLENTIIHIGEDSPISLMWAVCDGCSGLPWRN